MEGQETNIVMLGLGVIIGNLYRIATKQGKAEIKRNMIKLVQSLDVMATIETGNNEEIVESLESLGFKDVKKIRK